jgi:hypothetical protein
MKTAPMTALSIAALMFLSIFTSISSLLIEEEQVDTTLPDITEDPAYASSATSPGHVVFGQYLSSDNCGHCSKQGGGSASHHGIKTAFPDEYVYVTYMSVDYGNTGSARAGKISPYSWPWTTSGAPDAYFGDRTDRRQSGASANYDTYDNEFSSGGGMHTSVNDYQMVSQVTPNGNVFDIEIAFRYSGSGTPPANMMLYSAITEDECTTYTYVSSGIPHGYNCWMGWLTNGDTYKTKNSGSGTSFTSVSPTSTWQSVTWSNVPTSLIQGGTANALVVGVLMGGTQVSVGGTSPHVYGATDSSMMPLVDIGISDFSVSNPSANLESPTSYVNGDIVDVEVEIKNKGVDAYSAGGDIEFYTTENNVDTSFGTVSINSLSATGTGNTQTATATLDTTNLPPNAWQSKVRVKLINLDGDGRFSNNMVELNMPHDLIPIARKAQVIDSNEIERGSNFWVEAKVSINDNVDLNTSFFTFELETTPHNTNDWSSSIVTGGEEIFNIDTDNEHREYLFSPTMDMGAGNYDIRSRAIDSRDQVSDWHVTENAFILMNALPVINSYPVPTVKVQTSTMVHISDNIEDAETALEDLVITSTSPNFIAWHPDTQDIEVYFENIRFVSGTATASGVEINVDDGSAIAHGTLLFNVIENGQPRWAGVEKQYVDEASSGAINFLSYLSDTNDDGTVASPEDLVLAIIDNSNPELLEFDLREFTLNFETTDDDINGETTITVRASDGMSYSDQLVTIAINPINDAPRLDLSEYEDVRLKVGVQKIIYLNEIMSDVDGDLDEVIITASNPIPGAARINFLDNTLTMIWHDEGLQTVTIQVEDRYDSNIYTIVVDVYDSVPLLVGEGPDGDVKLSVTGVYVEEIPQIAMFLNKDDVTITSLTSTWQLCNEMTGVCTLNVVHEHDITQKSLGWTFDPFKGQLGDEGMRQKDQIKLVKVMAIDSAGDKYEYKNTLYWTANEEAPGPETMDADEVAALISELEAQIAIKESELALMTEGSSEHAKASATLEEIKSDYTEACTYGTCISDDSQAATTDDSESLNMNVLVGVIGVIILVLIIGLLFLRGGKNNDGPDIVDWANALPANDTVANSMYGGAQELFTQPVAVPAPAAVAQVQPGVLPLPPGGLPAGWSMEQWAHYGHQYQQ